MADEKTPLLSGFVVNIPKEVDELPAEEDFLRKGLSLEELMPYVSDPWWQNLRKIVMFLLSSVFLVIVVAACIIAVEEHQKGNCRASKNVTSRSGQIDQGIIGLVANNSSVAVAIATSTISSLTLAA